ncbi:MAG: DUF3857 domain-containing protein [Bacteroidales bacterium]|nr:DUF3857 domain-containing protein [Bacteroidales bacterium]
MKILFLLLCSLIPSFGALALDRNTKFGSPTREEMSMTVYEADPDAAAVLLYSNTVVKFEQAGEDFGILYKVKKRIKVLKPEGIKHGDVVVVFYDPVKETRNERVSRIKATAFNLEDGKVVSSKMTHDLKAKERIDDKYSQVKFSIPNVKVGTVIEYEYERHSDYYYTISDWYAQTEDMPVCYTEYHLEIPAWFNFNVENSGLILLEQAVDVSSFTFVTTKGSVTVAAGVNKFFGSDLPAIKEDDWVYCVEDFLSKVVHDLNWIEFPNGGRRRFTTTWEKVDSVLMENETFGKLYKMNNPLREKQAALEIPDSMSAQNRTALLRDLLMHNYTWNGNYGIYGISERKLQKDRTANSSTLNFALMSMLRDAGIKAYPVVMSRRTRGRLPWLHPSGESLNTMVLQVLNEEGEPFYVDAAATGCPVGVLPANLLVERARVIRAANSAKWVNLSHASDGEMVSVVTGRLSPEGVLEGVRNVSYFDNASADFRRRYHAAKDSTVFVQSIANRNNVEIEYYEVSGVDSSVKEVKEELKFTRTVESDGEHIYFNPFLFAGMESPFKAETRVLPVEFPFAVVERQIIQIELPEGYEVEDLPKPMQIRMSDDGLNCRVRVNQPEGKIIILINYNRQSMLYAQEEYPALRDLLSKLESKCNEMIVLKKK